MNLFIIFNAALARRCEINSKAAELILVIQLAALQIPELLLVNSDSFNSVRRTDRSTELKKFCVQVILVYPTVVSHLAVMVGLCTDDPKYF